MKNLLPIIGIFLSFFSCGDASFNSGGHRKISDKKITDDQFPKFSPSPTAIPETTPTLTPPPSPTTNPEMTVDEAQRAQQANPKFAMLVNDLTCAFCHLKIVGDVVSVRKVDQWSHGSSHYLTNSNTITGKWFLESTLVKKVFAVDIQKEVEVKINVRGGELPNYRGPEMVKDQNNDGKPDFPIVDFNAVKQTSAGKAKGKIGSINGVASGNIVLIGDDTTPIDIDGPVFVPGDLIIKGKYRGKGTIYVTGNIYIPHNVKAVKSIFPYPEDTAAALAKAENDMKNQASDALALVAGGSILIADLTSQIYDHEITPSFAKRAALKVDHVYSWYPKVEYEKLYGPTTDCVTQNSVAKKAFSVVEAFLYARSTVAGIARQGSYALFGGVIADHLHIIAKTVHHAVTDLDKSKLCSAKPNPDSGLPMTENYIFYDYRLQRGLKILDGLRGAFQ